MAILLTVLKVLLIIILSVLGLALLLILLVLFCPFVYKAEGEMYSDMSAGVSVGWLFAKVVGDYTKDKGFVMKLKILGIPIYRSDKEAKPKKEKKKKKAETVQEIETDKDEESAQELIPDDEYTPDSDAAELTESEEEEYEEVFPPEPSRKEKRAAKKKAKKEKAEEQEKKSFGEKVNDTLDKINKKKDFVLTKKDHIEQFLDRPYVQKTIERVKKALVKILKSIMPKKGRAYLHIGFDDPADTGELIGLVSPFCFLYMHWLNIEPDFEKKVLEGDLFIKGRIFIISIVAPAIRIAISRDFWKTYKLAKKI